MKVIEGTVTIKWKKFEPDASIRQIIDGSVAIVDLDKLKKQKEELLLWRNRAAQQSAIDKLSGILHLLDAIQDGLEDHGECAVVSAGQAEAPTEYTERPDCCPECGSGNMILDWHHDIRVNRCVIDSGGSFLDYELDDWYDWLGDIQCKRDECDHEWTK